MPRTPEAQNVSTVLWETIQLRKWKDFVHLHGLPSPWFCVLQLFVFKSDLTTEVGNLARCPSGSQFSWLNWLDAGCDWVLHIINDRAPLDILAVRKSTIRATIKRPSGSSGGQDCFILAWCSTWGLPSKDNNQRMFELFQLKSCAACTACHNDPTNCSVALWSACSCANLS